MDIEQVLSNVLNKLNALIFEIEQIKSKIKKETFTIDIKDNTGKVIKTIKI